MSHERGIEAGIESSGMAGWDHIEERAVDFLKAYLSASNQVLVPREPTKVMLDSAYACGEASEAGLMEIYDMFLARAPNPFKDK